MPIYCACVWFDGQHGASSPPSLPTVDRKVRKIEFLLESVKCIIADDAGASQLAKPCGFPASACAALASEEQPPAFSGFVLLHAHALKC